MARKLTISEFIERGKRTHPNENLDYSKVQYKGTKTPVTIIDHDLDENGKEYGEYQILPVNFFRGQSHPLKRNKKISKSKRLSNENFIEKLKQAHKGENLDFSKVKYNGAHKSITIIDPVYGEYKQEANSALKGHSCKLRGINKQRQATTYTTEHFIDLAKKVWINGNLSFEKVDYKGSQTPIIVTCHKIGCDGKEHGDFQAYPDALIQGKGCPKCGNHLSMAEDEIADFISSLIGADKVKKRDKTVLNGKELDVYVPMYNLAIEYDGLRWHSEMFNKDRNYHLNKTKLCNEKGIHLIHVFEDEWIYHKDVIFAKLRHIFQKDNDLPKVMGRKCVCRSISKVDAENFLNKYHIQGFANSSVYIGCFYKDDLIGVATFTRAMDEWNLTRLSTDYDYHCQGVCSKLLNFFIKTYKPNMIKTFLDRRYGNENNNVYLSLGFKLDNVEKPNYSYTNGHGKRIHKFNFRKTKLSKRYGFPLSMTENEMAKKLGYYKIWDCGLFKYVWHNKN